MCSSVFPHDLQFRSRRSSLYTKDSVSWIETAAVSSPARSFCPCLSSLLILSLRFVFLFVSFIYNVRCLGFFMGQMFLENYAEIVEDARWIEFQGIRSVFVCI